MDSLTLPLLALNLVVLLVLVARSTRKSNAESSTLINQNLLALSESVTKLKDNLTGQFTDNFKQGDRLRSDIHKELNQLARELIEIKEGGKRVANVADELKTLQNVLSNPKQRGVLGEFYLQTVLENVLPPGNFQMQYKFKDGEIVDAVVFADRKKIIPIDSKFSLENYNRLIESEDKVEKERLAKLIKSDLKKRIDETSKYIRPDENTLDFAMMFIPSEAIFYDLLINKVSQASTSARDFIEYAFYDKKVIIVSPTTMLAYLQTVLQGLRSLQIEEKAKDIQLRVGQLGKHIAAYEDYMQRLGKSLGTTVNHFNNAHKEFKKVDKDVVKIADTSPAIEPLVIEKPVEE